MNPIIYVVAFFLLAYFLMIPFYFLYKKRKEKEKDLANKNRDQCILRVSGRNVLINGQKESEYENVGDGITGRAVVLPAGKYEVSANYEITVTGVTGNKNYKTEEPVSSTLILEPGFQYSLSVYFESAKQRYQNYPKDVGEVVCETVLDVSGFFSGYGNAYIIGYKEMDMDGNAVKAATMPK